MGVQLDLTLGAGLRPAGQCGFLLWAPRMENVELHFVGPQESIVAMERLEHGYFKAVVDRVEPGARYVYRLDDKMERPDPASRFQPDGVHGPSEVVDPRFSWQDGAWRGIPLRDYVIYELHVGTFTPEGTFEAILPRLPDLRSLGVTAIELMPVAQFPGTRNWGYDGTFPYAVQNSYGGPVALKRLVQACHAQGLAVVMDVVYNHVGPEGNYLPEFGPYFTEDYRTPWGGAINFDGPHSDEVRRYFIENALTWIAEFHVDGLRLDAVHAIIDPSARPFLQELGDSVHRLAQRLNRPAFVMAESDRNDARIISHRAAGGYGLDAVWNDDFHHSLHVLLTGEKAGYYADFDGTEDLAKALREGFVYSGQYSNFRIRKHGNSSAEIPGERFVVCAQNHDQVGNRKSGERLSQLVDFESLKLAAACNLLSPSIPLLFMGEEYGEPAPFQYFVSHSDAALIEAVRRGRAAEFAPFDWSGDVPDPQAEQTFLASKIQWSMRSEGQHGVLRSFYAELLRLRREIGALRTLDRKALEVAAPADVLLMRRVSESSQVTVLFHFGRQAATINVAIPPGRWLKLLDSSDVRWGGPGSSVPSMLEGGSNTLVEVAARSAVLFRENSED